MRGLPPVIVTVGTAAVFFALEAWTSVGRIAIVLGAAALLLLAWYGFGNGWRLRNPIHRLPEPQQKSPAEVAKRERTREIRNELTAVFHAFTTPAVSALKELTAQVLADMVKHSPAAELAASLLHAYAIAELDSAETELRRSLESHWPDDELLRERMLELDLNKKTADDYGFDTFIHYAHYRNLLTWVKRGTALIGQDLNSYKGFQEWSLLDQKLTDQLRQAFAAPELANYRSELEDKFKQ